MKYVSKNGSSLFEATLGYFHHPLQLLPHEATPAPLQRTIVEGIGMPLLSIPWIQLVEN